MNILFVDQFSEPGGAQLALLDVMDGVRQRGWAPVVMAPGNGFLQAQSRLRGIPGATLPLSVMSNGRKSAGDLLRFISDLPTMKAALQRAIEEYKIDLLYVNGPRVLPAAIGLEIPLIFHAHSYVNGFGPRWLAMHSVRRAAPTVIAVSRFIALQFEAASHLPIRVVYNGAPDFGSGDFRAAVPDKLRVGILGRLAPEKGQLDFVRAAELIGSDFASFTIYGDSLFSDSDYASKVRAEAQGAPVEFQGWREDVGNVYQDLDILAVPSFDREASTRVIMEAFSAGLAVVAYPSGGIPEIIDNGRTGVLTEAPSFDSLAAGILRIIGNRNELAAFALAGRAEWTRRFTKDRFQHSICEVIESVRGTQGNSARHSGRNSREARDSEYQPDKTRPAGAAPPLTEISIGTAGKSAGGVSRVQLAD